MKCSGCFVLVRKAAIVILVAVAAPQVGSAQGSSLGSVLHLAGAQAKVVISNENNAIPDDGQLARLVFPTIPAGYITQVVDVGLTFTLSVQEGDCDAPAFMRALEAQALVGWTFSTARSAKDYSSATGVAAGFYEAASTTTVDTHGNTTKTLEVHRLLLALISKAGLNAVVPTFGKGGVESNGNIWSDPMCAPLGGGLVFPGHPNESGDLLAYSDSELAPYLKVFSANGGTLLTNPGGFMYVTP